VQKGLRDHLLCKTCEQFINVNYEQPFLRMWYTTPGVPQIIPDQLVEILGLDYAAFKLFHLSVLWRASVASIPAFAPVALGPKHSERLRLMLLRGDPGSRARYGILGALLTNPGSLSVCYGLVVGPESSRYDGHRAYNMVYGGCVWYVLVSGHEQPALFRQTLTTTGTLRLTYREYTEHPPLKAIAASRRSYPAK
jgi:hypothetical protein